MRTYEDFTEGLEIDLGPYPVTRNEVIEFAREFDPQPFHLDEEAAKDTLLGGLSASGWHSCAMMMRMMADAYILDSSSQGSPGVEYVRWKRPVRPGDVLHGTARVVSRRLSSKRPTLGILKITTDLRNQTGETVLESAYTLLVLTREGLAA
ncbi:MaoC family dehydratase [Aurantimonas coralicida]|uniref:MaoC family dehydratase n=1 Tax=Aurantimonas coralicida TaxID=182270 RepID=UPI001D1940CF|nr:MaoC family dehydratase [Aurantimonas coralicida]MCC4297593.1 MaoC family dehydratase [Aurantimonas coralicida]MCW7542318.1 MaoC family dehydratase [Aurantimonas litoralis]